MHGAKAKKDIFLLLCSWVRASWISVNNCPTGCDYVQCIIFL